MNLLNLGKELNNSDLSYNGTTDYNQGKLIHYLYKQGTVEIVVFSNNSFNVIKAIGFRPYADENIAVMSAKKEIKSDNDKVIVKIFNNVLKAVEKAEAKANHSNNPKYILKEDSTYTLTIIYYLISILPIVIFLGYFFYTKIKIYKSEKFATDSFKDENEKLFGLKSNDPGDSAFSNYISLINAVDTVVKTNKPGALVLGDPGLGKTFVIRRTLYKLGVEHYEIFKGSSIKLDTFYLTLYKNRKSLIVLDDFDEPLKKMDYVNVLKAITDSYGSRVVTLPNEITVVDANKASTTAIPRKFIFEGKIIVVTNLKLTEIDSALRSRLLIVDVKFNVKETLDIASKMVTNLSPDVPMEEKQEVLTFLSDYVNKNKDVSLDLRKIQDAFNTRHNNPELWKKLTIYSLKNS